VLVLPRAALHSPPGSQMGASLTLAGHVPVLMNGTKVPGRATSASGRFSCCSLYYSIHLFLYICPLQVLLSAIAAHKRQQG
jgi:hypothetical protein